MKKNNKSIIIIIGIICFILTFVMYIQFKIINETNITSIELMREEELRTEISNIKIKYDDINKKIADTNLKLEEYKENIKNDKESSGTLYEELKQSNMILGKTNLKGEGVIITLKSASDLSIYPDGEITDSDMHILVNELNVYDAEAISINDERLLNMTQVRRVYTNMSINKAILSEPFIIKAIGKSTYLEAKISSKIEQLKSRGITAEVITNNNVLILKYQGDIKTKYMN